MRKFSDKLNVTVDVSPTLIPLCANVISPINFWLFSYIHFQVRCMKSYIPFFYFYNLLTGACWSVFICACMNFRFCVTLYLYFFFISNIYSINCAHLFYLGHICLRLFNVRKGVWTLLIYLGILYKHTLYNNFYWIWIKYVSLIWF